MDEDEDEPRPSKRFCPPSSSKGKEKAVSPFMPPPQPYPQPNIAPYEDEPEDNNNIPLARVAARAWSQGGNAPAWMRLPPARSRVPTRSPSAGRAEQQERPSSNFSFAMPMSSVRSPVIPESPPPDIRPRDYAAAPPVTTSPPLHIRMSPPPMPAPMPMPAATPMPAEISMPAPGPSERLIPAEDEDMDVRETTPKARTTPKPLPRHLAGSPEAKEPMDNAYVRGLTHPALTPPPDYYQRGQTHPASPPPEARPFWMSSPALQTVEEVPMPPETPQSSRGPTSPLSDRSTTFIDANGIVGGPARIRRYLPTDWPSAEAQAFERPAPPVIDESSPTFRSGPGCGARQWSPWFFPDPKKKGVPMALQWEARHREFHPQWGTNEPWKMPTIQNKYKVQPLPDTAVVLAQFQQMHVTGS
ncbi:hypothetical protein CALCODRAFT_38420 [Calocera cornea HHB12733]|uniref:Uncharacterized protein n=1 Tax=Calocera cornea HHB12733 TaxID=1353952 RepID=A0A165DYA4_9BASI|nr:hypothetical protein CALCODRAFT_38420 [Calocera cornea HHB12733]